MKRTHSIFFCSLVLLLIAGVSGQALAQQPGLELDAWDIEVWPEYDKPSVLFIYSGTLSDDMSLPQEVRIPVPAGVTINAIAKADSTGGLFEVPWKTETTDTGQDVLFTVDTPRFVVEFYADVLSPPPNRSFELPLRVPYAARQGSLSLRQPARSSDMTITPDLARTGTDSLGNPQYSQQLGALVAGQEIPLRVSYTKPDADPSVTAATEPGATADLAQASGGLEGGTPDWVPWLAGGLVFVLVAALAVYLFLQWQQRRAVQSRQARRREARERGTPSVRKSLSEGGETNWQYAYCPQCGRKFEQADKFCRSCGTERH